MLPGPVAPLHGILLAGNGSVIRVDISWRALQEETEGLGSASLLQLAFYRCGHHARKVGRILEVVSAEDDRMASVIHQDRKGLSVRRIDAQDRDRGVDGRGRDFGGITTEHVHGPVLVYAALVLAQ